MRAALRRKLEGIRAGRCVLPLAAVVFVSCATQSIFAQSQRGTFDGTDSSRAKPEDSKSYLVRALAGAAQSRVEIDTLDWRRKWTLRLLVSAPDTGMIVIRWATAARPMPGTYPAKIVASGVSHADPKFVTVTFSARESGGTREYVIGGFENRVVISRAGADGSVAGTFSFLATRFAADPSTSGGGHSISRGERGSFESAPGGTVPQPSMSMEQQQRILSRALTGFAISWTGAENGDGNADSTRSAVKARAFLTARWKEALIVDSLATSADHFFVRVRGRFVPVVCTLTAHDYAPRCVTPERGSPRA